MRLCCFAFLQCHKPIDIVNFASAFFLKHNIGREECNAGKLNFSLEGLDGCEARLFCTVLISEAAREVR